MLTLRPFEFRLTFINLDISLGILCLQVGAQVTINNISGGGSIGSSTPAQGPHGQAGPISATGPAGSPTLAQGFSITQNLPSPALDG
jgi:hypothetical protein